MQKIKIVTDSTTDLSPDIIEELNIHVVPLTVTLNGETYRDKIDIASAEFIEKMEAASELPKTSQPAVGQFVELYDKLGEDGSQVLSIHMTSGMSGTHASAASAAKMTSTHVEVIDSTFMAGALGFQVVAAAEMAQSNQYTMDEIVARVNEVREHSHLYVVVQTLENLVKGGRIGKATGLIGSLLNIKPIASLANGVYTPVAKVRSQSQIIKTLTKYFQEDVAGKAVKGVVISHANAVELANSLKDSIYKISGYENIQIQETTAVISTHTGAGAIACCYLAE